jgi:hypothetical protein
MFSRTNSPVSPVDRSRLLTAPSKMGSHECSISNFPQGRLGEPTKEIESTDY